MQNNISPKQIMRIIENNQNNCRIIAIIEIINAVKNNEYNRNEIIRIIVKYF